MISPSGIPEGSSVISGVDRVLSAVRQQNRFGQGALSGFFPGLLHRRDLIPVSRRTGIILAVFAGIEVGQAGQNLYDFIRGAVVRAGVALRKGIP